MVSRRMTLAYADTAIISNGHVLRLLPGSILHSSMSSGSASSLILGSKGSVYRVVCKYSASCHGSEMRLISATKAGTSARNALVVLG
jgi:hypothetical protein